MFRMQALDWLTCSTWTRRPKISSKARLRSRTRALRHSNGLGNGHLRAVAENRIGVNSTIGWSLRAEATRQADALEIEAGAKRRLVTNMTRCRSVVRVRGTSNQHSAASNPEVAGVADIGLSHKDIHEAEGSCCAMSESASH